MPAQHPRNDVRDGVARHHFSATRSAAGGSPPLRTARRAPDPRYSGSVQTEPGYLPGSMMTAAESAQGTERRKFCRAPTGRDLLRQELSGGGSEGHAPHPVPARDEHPR